MTIRLNIMKFIACAMIIFGIFNGEISLFLGIILLLLTSSWEIVLRKGG